MEVVNVETEAVDIIGNTVKFLLDCKDNGEIRGAQEPPSIYLVPSEYRDLSPSSFNPKLVSIGPLHRQDEHLQGFEVQKGIYLHSLLHRLGIVPEKTLRECAEKVIRSIERIKACYAGSMTYNDFELAKMMVIDGCFILEFIQSLSQYLRPSWTSTLINRSITYDLVLIENQIPFFVLEIIFECTFVASGQMVPFTTHMEVLLKYYNLFCEDSVVRNVSLASTPDHILGLVHKYYQPMEPMSSSFFGSSTEGHSAMELERAGMKFRRNEDQNWAMAMKLELPLLPFFMTIPRFPWCRQPTLRMPRLFIYDSTEMILRNLIIYEYTSRVRKYVTSYVSRQESKVLAATGVAAKSPFCRC